MVVHINGYEIAVEEGADNQFNLHIRRRGEMQWLKGGTFSDTMTLGEMHDALVNWTNAIKDTKGK